MRSNSVVYLINRVYAPGDISDEGESLIQKMKIYGNQYKSLNFKSKLNAAVEGLRVKGRVEVYSFEYKGQEELQMDSKTSPIYEILDVAVNGDKTVLTYGERIKENG